MSNKTTNQNKKSIKAINIINQINNHLFHWNLQTCIKIRWEQKLKKKRTETRTTKNLLPPAAPTWLQEILPKIICCRRQLENYCCNNWWRQECNSPIMKNQIGLIARSWEDLELICQWWQQIYKSKYSFKITKEHFGVAFTVRNITSTTFVAIFFGLWNSM